MDLDDSVQMTFQFKSFLFSKMQEYEAPRTWTVSLPATTRNRSIIEQSQSADSTSNFPYTAYPVTYIDTNETIIDNGVAYMTGYSAGRINFVFVIGKTLGVLRDLSEVKLTELSQRIEDVYNWNRSSSFNDMSDGFGLVNWFNYTNEDRSYTVNHADMPMAVSHPVVTFEWVLNRIAYDFGVTLSGLADYVPFDSIAFPLKRSNGESAVNIIEVQQAKSTPGQAIVDGMAVPFGAFQESQIKLVSSAYFYHTSENKDVYIKVTHFIAAVALNYANVILKVVNKAGVHRDVFVADESPNGSGWKYEIFNQSFIFGSDDLYFYFSITGSGFSFIGATFDFEDNVRLAYYKPSATGGIFPIIPNLPDMTCAEFINQCCMLTGLFPFVDPDTPTVVDFYSVKTLYDNIPSAQDWSRYMLKSTESMAEAEDMEFIIDGYSQVNRMQYKEDELNTLSTSGRLTVSNQNIPPDGELFTLAFAAGRMASVNNQTVDYPLYDIKIEAGQLVRNPKNQGLDIVGKIVSVGGVNTLQFTDDLLLSAIDDTTNYTYYQQLIAKPRIIREKFKITGAVLAAVDVRIPIYLEQYGQYYAILEAQITDTYEADVTLLEIK